MSCVFNELIKDRKRGGAGVERVQINLLRLQ